MSEDVKPRQFCVVKSKYQDKFEFGELGNRKWIAASENIYKKKNEYSETIELVELEPTLQLMKEMGEAIIDEYKFESKDEVLEKYRKFLEGIEK